MNKNPIVLIAIAFIILALSIIRLPEGVRSVDIVSLLGTGVLVGVLITLGITRIRQKSS